MDGQLAVVLGIAGVLVTFGVMSLLILKRSLHDVPSGSALVIRSASGVSKVSFDRAVVIPFMHSAELVDITAKSLVLERTGPRGVRCADGIRASLRAVFVVRVNPTERDVNAARQRSSAAGLASVEYVRELFADGFMQAIESVAARFNFDELCGKQDQAADTIAEVIGSDLDGFVLESVSLTRLEMVPASELDSEDLHDAQGLRKITQVTTEQRLRVEELNTELRTRLAKIELQEAEILLVLERQKQAELSRYSNDLRGAPAPSVDELRARLDERVRQIVDLVQSRS